MRPHNARAFISNLSSTLVTWQVNSVTSGNSTFGTIDTNGLYTAPTTSPAEQYRDDYGDRPGTDQPYGDGEHHHPAASGDQRDHMLNSSNQYRADRSVRQLVALYPDGDRRRKYRCVLVRQRQPHVQFNARNTLGNGGTFPFRYSDSHWQPIRHSKAPQIPPPGGAVAVTAVSQANSAQTLCIPITLTFGIGSMTGSYAFSMNGRITSGNTFRARAGSLRRPMA